MELCRRYGARLMVDEAHGVGVLGKRGAGASELFGLEDEVDLRMGTFSKSLASCGGFIAGSEEVIEYLRIASRSFIFSASAVPAAVGAALGALRIIRSEGPELMARLLDNAAYLRQGLRDLGLKVVEPGTLPDGTEATTPVVPVIVGEDWQAVLLWKALFEAGVYTNVALHPAVPPGGALLRTSLMANHERDQLDRALRDLRRRDQAFPGPADRVSGEVSPDSIAAWTGRWFDALDGRAIPVFDKRSALSGRDDFSGVDSRSVSRISCHLAARFRGREWTGMRRRGPSTSPGSKEQPGARRPKVPANNS